MHTELRKKRIESHCRCEKDYCFVLLTLVVVERLDGSVSNCLRVGGTVRCLARND